jgi:hypothetical protein
MAFTKGLWKRIGGFPEDVFLGEDTLFDFSARSQSQPDFANNAKALYRPRNTFVAASRQMARYAFSDGLLRVRGSRLIRNTVRCLLQVCALTMMPWSVIPLLLVLTVEVIFAFKKDARYLPRFGTKALAARFAFSIAVPWIVAVNQFRGMISVKPPTNRQNMGAGAK